MNIIKDYTFYKIYADTSDKYLSLCERLESKLPHGSGINGNWHIKAYKYADKIHLLASNHFDAMNEVGYYCHIYDFTAHYIYNPVTQVKCSYCNGKGYRLLSEMAIYHPNMSLVDLRNWLINERQIYFYTYYNFECNICNGTGLITIPEFELSDRRILFGKELNCCGYGLEDYLSQALYIWAE